MLRKAEEKLKPKPTPPFIGRKVEIDLGEARDKKKIIQNCLSLTILDKGTGNFVLTFRFAGLKLYEFELDQDEILNGDIFEFGTANNLAPFTVFMTNTAQSGLKVKFIVTSGI